MKDWLPCQEMHKKPSNACYFEDRKFAACKNIHWDIKIGSNWVSQYHCRANSTVVQTVLNLPIIQKKKKKKKEPTHRLFLFRQVLKCISFLSVQKGKPREDTWEDTEEENQIN